VRRVKNGTPSTHPLLGDELRALRRLQRESMPSPFVFVSERGSPFTTAGFARMIERVAVVAGLELKAHPHMLRHACGYALANKGHDTRAIQGWLGHRSITSTAIYTALAPNRFKDFWRDWAGRERQLERIAKAKVAVVYKGRPAFDRTRPVRQLKAQGLGPTEIAKTLKIGRASVYRVLEGAE
jgi:hypothetical protein